MQARTIIHGRLDPNANIGECKGYRRTNPMLLLLSKKWLFSVCRTFQMSFHQSLSRLVARLAWHLAQRVGASALRG